MTPSSAPTREPTARLGADRLASWAAARNVLCVRLDTIGDVLMSGPAIRALRPGRRITLLTSSPGAAAGGLMPEVDQTIVYEAPWMKTAAGGGSPERDLRMIERLRTGRFEAAVIFTVYSQSPLPAALLCLLAGVPLRLAHCRENPYALLTDWLPEPEPDELLRHEVRRQLDLVGAIGARCSDERLRVELGAGARAAAHDTLTAAGVNLQRPWVVVHPGASAPSRRYSSDLLARACQMLAEHGLQLVFTGEQGEGDLVEAVRKRISADSASLAGRLEFHQLAALLAESPLLIAGNTGPVHIAAAVQTPVVDLYALTNPQHTPWQVPSTVLFNDVPCRWCYKSVCPEGHHLCLRGVEPEQVADAALALLEAPARAPETLPFSLPGAG